ncbi:pectate lyase [Mucilaginibacter terrae]|uniref:PelA/Pel-15E family pectate lyase n=1 Tax=Mucilaginibacter terrae TaxID=1955052 RepID=A0ABU3GNT3_9SPHI|nr:pectate lyase [Mucilaginibacter terrae]MDT3401444.1 PelA/Pel-15E family pectate lyase [Mucilaginibacter terrae]
MAIITKRTFILTVSCFIGLLWTKVEAQVKTDPVAENMLLYQRSVGGWPKAVNEVKVDYNKNLTDDQKQLTRADSNRIDATIDNGATHKEITYLVIAYKQTQNSVYLKAAEKGIRYLLKAQYPNGGWPQYYPDISLYRAQITYNDNAMINTLDIMYNIANGTKGFDVVNKALVAPCKQAVKKGIDCIIKTQVKVNGKLTAWTQQYDKKTLQPVAARKFELVGLSASESAAIVEFLMRQLYPTTDVKAAIKSAVEWFAKVKIEGYRFERSNDGQLVADAGSTIWARFYEIGTNKPFFSGRDSQKKYNIAEIEKERRTGYAWYGNWPQKILDKQYAAWMKKTGDK